MTQENKELLLKDLCARLPYGVYCQIRYKRKNKVIEECKQLDGAYFSDTEFLFRSESGAEYSADYKPYLRPMSSMTEEEFESLKEFSGLKYDQLELSEWNSSCKTLEFYLDEIPSEVVVLVFDWLNAHHFDYRGLIPKGLALEAPKDMYNTWTPLRSGLKENENGQIIGGLKL